MIVNGLVVAVAGSTGQQGGAVARRLLADGWTVRALTRDPTSPGARALATPGRTYAPSTWPTPPH
nr:NmrA family NAD(P)-binding protein [Streptomyces sp. WAC01526]